MILDVYVVHMANRVAYVEHLEGYHVEVLDESNSKFNGKNKLMLTSLT
jgi:hypothetical protein